MVKFIEERSYQQNIIAPHVQPSEMIKSKDVALLFANIEHDGKSGNDDDKKAFCKKTKSLSILLERHTPKKSRQELIQWYRQLKVEIKNIKGDSNLTPEKRKKMILNKEYEYASEVHEQNIRILMNSPIVEVEAEAEFGMEDEDMIKTIRGGKRTDDKSLVFTR
jgi:hypothetical protein